MPGLPVVACFVASILAGAAGYLLGVPLAWVLGPLLATALFAIAGVTPFAPTPGRRAGQIIVGAAVGLSFTAPILASLLDWLPIIVLSAFVAILIGAIVSIPFARAAGVDGKTAYFSMMPGGLAEMANTGARHGGQLAPISLAQALRAALVVFILPTLIVSLGIDGGFGGLASRDPLGPLGLAALFAAGGAGVLLIRLLRLNNPWMVGALVGAATLSVLELVSGRVPDVLFYTGQFLIGISIGARFKRDLVRTLPRLCAATVAFAILLLACLLGYAFFIAYAGGIDYASAALSVAPGGFAEMTVTAKTLHLDVALVVAFHIVRSVMVNSASTHLYSLFDRAGLFRAGERLLPRRPAA